MIKEIAKLIEKSVLLLIKGYQITRGARLSCCRFYPSCSDYCALVLKKHGIFKGLGFAALRLFKCQPWHQGGADFSGLS